MDLTLILLLAGGLALLVLGGEFLVRGAAQIALALGVAPLVIGLTVVAYGTSTPELVVSLQAGLAGQDDIAVSNVVGSNIFNVLFILGFCALILPLTVDRSLVRRDLPLGLVASLLLWILAVDGRLGWIEGGLFVAGAIAYTWFSFRAARQAGPSAADPGVEDEPRRPWRTLAVIVALALAAGTLWLARQALEDFAPRPVELAALGIGAAAYLLAHAGPAGALSRWRALLGQVGLIVAGLGLLMTGGRWLVDGAVTLARSLEVDETVIGLTIVAAGTSLPEVATSIVATLRGQRDIAIGNVVGSNLYNILVILGLCALVTPGGLAVAPVLIEFDLPVMVAVAALCLPVFYSGFTIARWEGALFFAGYVAYVTFLILTHARSGHLDLFGSLLAWFVLPVITLLVAATGLRSVWTTARAR